MKYISFMEYAVQEAKKAYIDNEVPVGAVIVKDGNIVCSTHNMCEKETILNHAEIIAIKNAIEILGKKYLDDCELYVTLEPCAMCAGAIKHARLKRVYIGCMDEKEGCVGSKFNLLYGTKTEVYHGILEDECKTLLKSFFKEKR